MPFQKHILKYMKSVFWNPKQSPHKSLFSNSRQDLWQKDFTSKELHPWGVLFPRLIIFKEATGLWNILSGWPCSTGCSAAPKFSNYLFPCIDTTFNLPWYRPWTLLQSQPVTWSTLYLVSYSYFHDRQYTHIAGLPKAMVNSLYILKWSEAS